MIATSISARIGRAVAIDLHSSELGAVLGPRFRTEAHALVQARHDFGQLRAPNIGSFDPDAMLESFRDQLTDLGGWETATQLV